MNKTELIQAVADKTELSKKDAEAAIAAMVDAITEALTREEKVQLVGVGSFEVKRRSPSPSPSCPCSRPARP